MQFLPHRKNCDDCGTLPALISRAYMIRRLACIAGLVSLAACSAAPGPDTVLVNGKVFTANPETPWAQAMAITGERITAVGDTAVIDAAAGVRTRRIDLGGRTVIPGINDAHTHISITPPFDRLTLPFDPTTEQIADALRAQVAAIAPGRLVQGEFGQEAWGNPAFTRAWLDAIAPAHPVWLTAFTGHGALLNSAALSLIGYDETTRDPAGGRIVRDDRGRVNGRLEEYGLALAQRRLGMRTEPAEVVRLYRQYAAEARALGITSTQLLGDALPAAEASKRLVEADVPMRWKYFRYPIALGGDGDDTMDSRPPLPPQPTPLIDMRGMKWIFDGTPIEWLGFMREPYADAPNERGRLNLSPERIAAIVGWAYGSEDPLAVHAFGDAAIETYVRAIERGGRAEVWRAKRPRIEHADMLRPDLIPPVRALGMVVVQNPTHVTFPEIFFARYGKDRLEWMQPMKSLLDAGIRLAIGSDGPMSPFLNIMAAVTHPTNPKEALTREQAVTAYTAGAAFAEFKEREKGQIAVGMLADLAVLSTDLFTVPVAEMEGIRSVLTMLGGRIIHETGAVR
jgi:predicted amidohydrolase YtcJ